MTRGTLLYGGLHLYCKLFAQFNGLGSVGISVDVVEAPLLWRLDYIHR